MRITVAEQRGGTMWDGARLAEHHLDDAIPRPSLLGDVEWEQDGRVVQALLWRRLHAPVLSPSPDLAAPVELDQQWWAALRTALGRLRATPSPPGREVITQRYVHRIPRFLPQLHDSGIDLHVHRWETSHGDLHWANLTASPLTIIDWEGWGPAPAGTDAATLHAYALPHPEIAAAVRRAFAPALDPPAGRLAHLVIAAQIIQASERDPLHARLEPHVTAFAHHLLDEPNAFRHTH